MSPEWSYAQSDDESIYGDFEPYSKYHWRLNSQTEEKYKQNMEGSDLSKDKNRIYNLADIENDGKSWRNIGGGKIKHEEGHGSENCECKCCEWLRRTARCTLDFVPDIVNLKQIKTPPPAKEAPPSQSLGVNKLEPPSLEPTSTSSSTSVKMTTSTSRDSAYQSELPDWYTLIEPATPPTKVVKPMRNVENVYITNRNLDYLSRHDLLNWVNGHLTPSVVFSIEELCTGVGYCELFNLLFPSSVQLKKVNYGKGFEDEFENNFKILQIAFNKIHVDKVIPINKLVRGRFQDNFEFLQWFRKFFVANYDYRQNPLPSKEPIQPDKIQEGDKRKNANNKNLHYSRHRSRQPKWVFKSR